MISPVASEFQFMVIIIDIMHRHDPSNEMRRQLQPKKTKVMLYYRPVARGCVVGTDALTSQIKGPLFSKRFTILKRSSYFKEKVHYFTGKGPLLLGSLSTFSLNDEP